MTIDIRGLNKRFGDLWAVRNLDLRIHKGEVFGFLGPNGAGKTTTILMILGMLNPSSGTIRVFGQEVNGIHKAIRSRVGVIPEHQSLYDDLTAWEYLHFFASLHGLSDPSDRITELLTQFSLMDNRGILLGEFSHGMRQKINICRGLLHNPDLLILDEPILGLDPASVRLVRDIVLGEKQAGKTVLISSHLLSEIEKTADRVGIMSNGELIREGSLDLITSAVEPITQLEIELLAASSAIIDRVNALSQVTQVETHGNRILVSVEDPQEARSIVSQTISDAGGTIVGFTVKSPDLEDAFLSITEQHVQRLKDQIA